MQTPRTRVRKAHDVEHVISYICPETHQARNALFNEQIELVGIVRHDGRGWQLAPGMSDIDWQIAMEALFG